MKRSRAANEGRTGRWLIAGQSVLLMLAATTFTLLPPGEGPVLAVSLHDNSAASLLDGHNRLLGAGRLPGSLVITGERPSFWKALTGHSVLIIPALPILCGSVTTSESPS